MILIYIILVPLHSFPKFSQALAGHTLSVPSPWGRQPEVYFCSSFGFLCSWRYIFYFKFFETNSSLRHIFGCKVLGLNDCQKNAIFLCS